MGLTFPASFMSSNVFSGVEHYNVFSVSGFCCIPLKTAGFCQAVKLLVVRLHLFETCF